MNLKTLDTFTFMFIITQENENLMKRVAILNEIRSFINTIDFFSRYKITMKPMRIDILDADFYFAFDTKGSFTMGFACSEEKIESLSEVMNEISRKLIDKISREKNVETNIFSASEYKIAEKCDLFAKLIQNQNLNKICYQHGTTSPKKIDLQCISEDSTSSIDISLYKEKNQKMVRIELSKDANTLLPIDAAKDAAKLTAEIANGISNELLGEN